MATKRGRKKRPWHSDIQSGRICCSDARRSGSTAFVGWQPQHSIVGLVHRSPTCRTTTTTSFCTKPSWRSTFEGNERSGSTVYQCIDDGDTERCSETAATVRVVRSTAQTNSQGRCPLTICKTHSSIKTCCSTEKLAEARRCSSSAESECSHLEQSTRFATTTGTAAQTRINPRSYSATSAGSKAFISDANCTRASQGSVRSILTAETVRTEARARRTQTSFIQAGSSSQI